MIALADATAPSGLVVPLCDVPEAALVRGEEAHGVATLAELARILGVSPPGHQRLRLRPSTMPARYPTWPTCAARPSAGAPSRWRPRARTIS